MIPTEQAPVLEYSNTYPVLVSIAFVDVPLTKAIRADRIMAPNNVCILILQTCQSVTIHSKRYFVNMIRLRILEW